MQKAGTEEAHLVEDIFAHVLLFKIDLEVPGWSQVPFQNLPGFFLIMVPSALACEAVSVRCSRLIWMQLGLKFDAYYKPSTISTQPSGLRSCSINNSPAFLWLFSLFSPPPPAHLFLFLPLSQALKKTSFFVFLLTLVFFTRDLPSSSQFSWPLPIFPVWPRNFWQHACVWERNPASLVTWLEFYTNWRQSETFHLSLQQLLPWGLMAIARWQRPSSQPPEHLGEPRALCFDMYIYHWICWSRTAALLPAWFCRWSVLAFNFYSRQLCSVKRLGRIYQ